MISAPVAHACYTACGVYCPIQWQADRDSAYGVIKNMHYRACIVRAWCDTDENSAQVRWRLALESPSTGMREGFTSFHEMAEALWRYLAAEERNGLGSQPDLALDPTAPPATSRSAESQQMGLIPPDGSASNAGGD